jgi:hypothetical protein
MMCHHTSITIQLIDFFKVKNTLIDVVDGFDQISIVYLRHHCPQWLILRRSLGLSLSCKLTTKVGESSKLTITLAGGRDGRGGRRVV